MNLSDAVIAVRDELSPLIPESDLVIPGGARSAAAAYVHIQLPLLDAGLQGYGFEDSARTDAQKSLAALNAVDRREWIHASHQAAIKETEWHSPQLSRLTSEWLSHAGQKGGALDMIIEHLPPPVSVRTQSYDSQNYGIVLRRGDKHFLVPITNPQEGEMSAARPIAGLGAGLSGEANTLAEALVGDDRHLRRGIAGNWQFRPMAPTKYGPVMIIGNDFQIAASDLEAGLASNAVDRFILVHDTPRDPPAPSLRIDQNIKPVDQMTMQMLAVQGIGRI